METLEEAPVTLQQYKIVISKPPKLGPPVHYIHVIWLAAFPDDVHEFYDELDAERWTIRCVRVYRDRSSRRFSYKSHNWRDVMPEATIGTSKEINRDSQFLARDITQEEFEDIWRAAGTDREKAR
jgi:hypothetical protein